MRFLRAGVVAAVFSGAPSTVWALARGEDPLRAARAAGALLGRSGVVPGTAAHIGISIVWTVVFAAVDRRRPWTAASGAAAGLAIAVLDIGVLGRRYPAIASLPLGPQLADHAAFGALLGGVLDAQR